MSPKISDLIGGKVHVFKKLKCLFEASGDQITAVRRKMAREQLKCRARFEARL
jgi:hypothetical protein